MSQNKKIKNSDSPKLDEALTIAQGIKQENQTKAQTKLIAQGIRKGIEIYKNQQNKKQRDINKRKKKQLKSKLNSDNSNVEQLNQSDNNTSIFVMWVPWGLVLLSWIFFVIYMNK